MRLDRNLGRVTARRPYGYWVPARLVPVGPVRRVSSDSCPNRRLFSADICLRFGDDLFNDR